MMSGAADKAHQPIEGLHGRAETKGQVIVEDCERTLMGFYPSDHLDQGREIVAVVEAVRGARSPDEIKSSKREVAGR